MCVPLSPMGSRFIRRVCLPIAAGALAVTTVAACGSSAKFIEADGVDTATKESAAKLTVSPDPDDKDVPVSAEIGLEVDQGTVSEVTLVDGDGDTVDGDMRSDDSSWVPAEPLDYDTDYTASVTAVDADDIPVTVETNFTTMSSPPNRQYASLWNSDEYEYGQAMPIMVDFPSDYAVPEDQRANVEKRLFVSADPVQPGAWHWFNGHHLEYRPENFWEPGSTITIRLGLGGLPLGDGLYGQEDITSTVHIDSTVKSVEVSNETKQLEAIENGEVVNTMPVSLGKDDKPSYSGTMIVMEKEAETTFDTTNEPGCNGKEGGDDCYITDIDFAQRLTWSGQYIHAAPWSVADQGVRNVSHGCVNVSQSDAEWIFNFTKLGTPVIITGTGIDLPYGDGYTAFAMSWDDFLAGSYLPPPTEPRIDADGQD